MALGGFTSSGPSQNFSAGGLGNSTRDGGFANANNATARSVANAQVNRSLGTNFGAGLSPSANFGGGRGGNVDGPSPLNARNMNYGYGQPSVNLNAMPNNNSFGFASSFQNGLNNVGSLLGSGVQGLLGVSPANAMTFGQQAQTADIGQFYQALMMGSLGNTPSEIESATGWYKDPSDNQWKFYEKPAPGQDLQFRQLRDDRMTQLPNVDSAARGWDLKLSDYFSFPQFEKNYPGLLGELKLRTTPVGSQYVPGGRYIDPTTGQLSTTSISGYRDGGSFGNGTLTTMAGGPSIEFFNDGYGGNVQNIVKHELNHAGQMVENFGVGGDPGMIETAILKAIRDKQNPYMSGIYDFADRYGFGDVIGTGLTPDQRKTYLQNIDRLQGSRYENYGKILDNAGIIDDLINSPANISNFAYNLYRSMPGEWNAELARAMDMTDYAGTSLSNPIFPQEVRLPAIENTTPQQLTDLYDFYYNPSITWNESLTDAQNIARLNQALDNPGFFSSGDYEGLLGTRISAPQRIRKLPNFITQNRQYMMP